MREVLVCTLLREKQPDILCLQECKSLVENIPLEAFAELGYSHYVARGQKSYNGVMILSKHPLEDAGNRDFCNKNEARHVSAKLENGLLIHNIYVPAGGDEPDPNINPKFAHKLQFLDEMNDWFTQERPQKSILVGDLNIAPHEDDVWSHKSLLKVVSHTPVEVEKLEKTRTSAGWIDIMRQDQPEGKLYSWWSYRARDWAASNRGRRLDHIWASEDLKQPHYNSFVMKEARGWEKPSDHAPVFAEFNL